MTDPRAMFDPRSGDPVAVLTWLADNPVPGGPSRESSAWRAHVTRLSDKAIPALLHALEYGAPDLQYTAQIALRTLGVEAWAHGSGRDLHYTVVIGNQEQRIEPLMKADVATGSVAETAPPYGTVQADPEAELFARMEAAGAEIENHRQAMRSLGVMRSETVRALLARGLSRAEVARRLGVHPNYVNQLAKGTAPRESRSASDK